MFWYLLFAHLIADYPLQPNWMVMKKTNLGILVLHTSVHLGMMLAIVGPIRRSIWPYLIILALVHFSLDLLKNLVNKLRPKWVIVPYIVDQLVHYFVIWLVAIWIQNRYGDLLLPMNRDWLVFANAYLLVTYVWFISERIFAYKNPGYRKEVISQFWPRMVSRAVLFSGLLLLWGRVSPVSISFTITSSFPYFSGENSVRAFLTDLGVALTGLLFVVWAI